MSFNYYYGMESEQFTFYRIPKVLIKNPKFKKLSSDAKILYGLMLDRMALSMRNGWFDEYNRVYIYYAVDDIAEDLGCSKPTCTKILSELDSKKGIGLIEKKRQGQGKPDIIYVKNFVQEDIVDKFVENTVDNDVDNTVDNTNNDGVSGAEDKNVNVQKSKNLMSRSKEIEPLEVKNFYPNNNNINNNNMSKNNHINQSDREERCKDMIDRYEKLIAENIGYDSWMQCGDISEKEQVDELYQLICDAVCVPRESIRIGGTDYPYKLVKAQFLKINYNHIKYCLECLNSVTSKINNIRAYLLTVLYNSVNSMNCYYQQEVQHDMYGHGFG